MYRSCGVYTEIITPREAEDIFPILKTDDLKVNNPLYFGKRIPLQHMSMYLVTVHKWFAYTFEWICWFYYPQGALYVPNDISAGNPTDICQSLAKGASLQGS